MILPPVGWILPLLLPFFAVPILGPTTRPDPAALTWKRNAAPARELPSRRVLRELKRELRERYPDKRRRAVARLAELDIPEAWELVLDALEDKSPEVADQAQLSISEWTDRRGLLLGKHGLAHPHELVRMRVAESFGRRTTPVDGTALARRLDPRQPRVARMLLWSLERLARGHRLRTRDPVLARRAEACLRGGLDAYLRADALAALAVMDPERAKEKLDELERDRDAAVRCAVLRVGEQLADAGHAERTANLILDESAAVRSQAIASLGTVASREAVVQLADALDREERPRLRLELVASLQRLTGRKYRDDPQNWKRFAGNLPRNWRPADPVEPEVGVERTAAFAGLPILSDRLCFLIDFSGSLWHERADGRTPKDVVDRELGSALKALAERTEFNVVPYTDEPHPWRKSLVANRGKAAADALRYFERCRENGPGSFFEAARFALADEGVDVVTVLTDGAPTGGEHWNLALLFDLLLHENRHRRAVFDIVLVEAAPALVRKWSAFATATGGRCIAVELDTQDVALRAR